MALFKQNSVPCWNPASKIQSARASFHPKAMEEDAVVDRIWQRIRSFATESLDLHEFQAGNEAMSRHSIPLHDNLDVSMPKKRAVACERENADFNWCNQPGTSSSDHSMTTGMNPTRSSLPSCQIDVGAATTATQFPNGRLQLQHDDKEFEHSVQTKNNTFILPNSSTFQASLESNLLGSIRFVFRERQIEQFDFLKSIQSHLRKMYYHFDSLKSIDVGIWREKIKMAAQQHDGNGAFDVDTIKRMISAAHQRTSSVLDIEMLFGKLRSNLDKLLRLALVDFTQNIKTHFDAKIQPLASSLNEFADKVNFLKKQIVEKISRHQLMINKCIKRNIVVCFSGYTNDSSPSKQELAELISKLGGTVAPRGEFHDGITHVVSPPSFPRTMRTLGASLLSKWVVSHDWLYECIAKGYWVDEREFGFRRTDNEFEGKRFYLADGFFRENEKYYNREIFLTFFKRIVKAVIVDSPDDADYVMVAEQRANGKYLLSWNQFSDFIDIGKK